MTPEERIDNLEKAVARLSAVVQLERNFTAALFLLLQDCVISRGNFWQAEQLARQYENDRRMLMEQYRDT